MACSGRNLGMLVGLLCMSTSGLQASIGEDIIYIRCKGEWRSGASEHRGNYDQILRINLKTSDIRFWDEGRNQFSMGCDGWAEGVCKSEVSEDEIVRVFNGASGFPPGEGTYDTEVDRIDIDRWTGERKDQDTQFGIHIGVRVTRTATGMCDKTPPPKELPRRF